MPDKKPLWEQHGFESLDQLTRFHQYVIDRRLATSRIPTDEGAEHHHAGRSSKKEEGAAELEPKKEEGAAEPRRLANSMIATATIVLSLEEMRRHPNEDVADWTQLTTLTPTQRQTNN